MQLDAPETTAASAASAASAAPAADAGSPDAAESPFGRFLRGRAGDKIFFEHLSGNNGDVLILKGVEHLLDKSGCRRCDDPAGADLILLNGGYSISDIWKFGIETLGHYRREFPDTPLAVAPSSFRFQGVDFAEVVGRGRAPVTFFARETKSREIITGVDLPDNAQVLMSRDAAFELRDGEFLGDLKARSGGRHVVVSMRNDEESGAAANDLGGLLKVGRGRFLPGPIRRPLARLRDAIAARRNVGGPGAKGVTAPEALKAGLARVGGDAASLPRVHKDISAVVGFEEFCDLVAGSALIVTDRLHVAIFGHLLRRPTMLLPGNNHKLRGIYDWSMRDYGSSVSLFEGN